MKRPTREPGQKGFTLIEAIVAMIIITVGLIMLAHLMVVSITMHETTEAEVKSIELAQAKLESLKAQFSNSLASGNLPADLAEGFHGPETLAIQTNDSDTQNYLYFDLSWTITDLSGGQKQVTMSISPMSYQGDSETETDQQGTNPLTITSVLAP